MFFKYNNHDLTEKNIYYLSMVELLNFSVIVDPIFVVCAVGSVLQEEQIDRITIISAIILASFGYMLSVVDAILRKITLRKRISDINKALNMDMFSVLSGKQLNESLIYKDDEWFIAVPSPECIILNKNYIRKDIEIKSKSKILEVEVHTIDGETIRYKVNNKWKDIVDRLEKWIH